MHIYFYGHTCICTLTMHTDVPGDRGQTLGALLLSVL
jgi:hypothetical protein